MVESYYNVKNGCKKWHDCYTCPFDDCHISVRESLRTGGSEIREQRHEMLKELFKQGYSTTEAADIVGVTSRTARRIRSLTKPT